MKTMILAALLVTPLAATADSIILSAPLAGQTLHTDDVDMSVYFTDSDTTLGVVAVYAPRTADATPSMLQMDLADGESTTFGLPGYGQASYTFARSGDAVTVTGTPLPIVEAMN
ncbi:hypothetical protein [Loktanella sp. M215]|uniref:hypothetical protein n=1 Tax=Loktanella sp. M215 TaxID=2675431 RepID=UPI001F1908EA|nr:hypothetical protein [Loktanella sp. M215]MCF7699343.1 hypothetical protein [Loktanella sp. M215]